MSKLIALIADDQRVHRNQIINWFVNMPISNHFAPFVECKYIKQDVSGEKNFDTIIKEMKKLDIAFVDLQWLEDGFEGWDGGNYIIKEIETKFPNCLIIPVTQFRFAQETKPEITTQQHTTYETIPKECDDVEKTKKFYLLLEKWQICRIGQIKDPSKWRKTLSAIEKNDYSGKIVVAGVEWVLSEYIFHEIRIDGEVFFRRNNLIKEIKKLISYPKNKLWGSKESWGKFTETYFRFLELDEERGFKKLLDIEKSAKEYIDNFIFLLLAQEKKEPAPFSNKAKIRQLRSHQCKETDIPDISKIFRISDIPDDYYDNLLIRYIVLTLCHIADKANKQNWKLNLTILNLFDHANESSSDINRIAKNFYYYTGISTDRSSKSISYKSYTENIFYKERDFIDNFDFQPILNEITINNPL